MSASGRTLDPRIQLAPAVSHAVVVSTVIEYALWAVLSVPIVWLAARLDPTTEHRARRILALLVLGVVLAIGVDLVLRVARQWLLPPPPRRFGRTGPFDVILGLEFVPDFMVYLAVLGAGLARAYFLRYRDRLEETRRLEAETVRLEVQLADARLSALRSQLNPHFLFNTLNAVSALVTRDPAGARRMISRLSDLLRHALEETDAEIPLAREIELAERYLDIMQVRFEGALEVRIDVEPGARAALVPNLVLQPLIENALKHGTPASGPARVGIVARVTGGVLVLDVFDNGPGPRPAAPVGVGTSNTYARLRALYGDDGTFDLTHAAGGGALARVRLPFHTTPRTMRNV